MKVMKSKLRNQKSKSSQEDPHQLISTLSKENMQSRQINGSLKKYRKMSSCKKH